MKITNGYRITPLAGADTIDLTATFVNVRSVFEITQQRVFARLITALAVELIDTAVTERGPIYDQPLAAAAGVVRGAAQSGNPWASLTARIDVLADPDLTAGPVLYALLDTDCEDYRQALTTRIANIEAWPYWDDKPRPVGFTDEEWAARGDTWRRVQGQPGGGVLDYTLALRRDLSSETVRGFIAESIPDATRRARVVVADDNVIYRRGLRTSGIDLDRTAAAVDAAANGIVNQLPELTLDMLYGAGPTPLPPVDPAGPDGDVGAGA